MLLVFQFLPIPDKIPSNLSTARFTPYSLARFRSNFLSGSRDKARNIASSRATSSPTGTTSPTLPLSRISAVPDRQFVATQGQPQARASNSTVDKPSNLEETTKRDARRISAKGFSTNPGRETLSCRPRRFTSVSSDRLRGPSPSIINRHSFFFLNPAKA